MPIKLDYMEYANDAAAQAAYVSSDAGYTADVTAGETFSADSVLSAGYEASKAFDNNFDTQWVSKNVAFPHWIKVDFGAGDGRIIRKITIAARNDAGKGSRVKDFKVQGSNNDSDWNDIYTGQYPNSADKQVRTFTFSNRVVYRYYRIYGTSDWDPTCNSMQIWEAEMMAIKLQCYSESTIKQQGSYSLLGLAAKTGSLNDTLTRAVSPTIDLSDLTKIKFGIYASRTGSNIKILIRDSGGTWSEYTPNITVANSWQTKEWNISGVSNVNKDAIDRIQIKIINAGAANVFYLDNMFANWWSKIFTEQIVLSDSFSRTWTLYRTFTETLHLADTIIVFRMFHRVFTETITLTDTVKKKIAKTFTETINLADTLRKKIGKTFIESLTLADTLVKRAIRQRANLLQALESDAMFPSGVVRNLQHGANAVKSISPVRGDWYIAIDTQKVYVCFVSGTWTQIYP